MDLVAYYVRYLAIYLLFGLTMGLSSISKLTDPVPEWFTEQFKATFVNTFPGLSAAWRIAGILEIAVALILVVSVVMLEFLHKRSKPVLKLGLGLAALTFTMLSIGQNISFQLAGAATLFFYFASALVALMVVIFDESTYREQSS